MKYLKHFEITIKHSDPISINHPLRNFSRKLEDIVITLQKSNELILKHSSVRRYFHSNGLINIFYEDIYFKKLLKLELKNDKENVGLYLELYKRSNNKNSFNFFNFIDFKLSKYKKNIEQISDFISTKVLYVFPLTELNNVLDKLEEYYIYTNSDKYNL